MKLFGWVILLVFLTQGAFASLSISAEFDKYNLGEPVLGRISIAPTAGGEAVVKALFNCPQREMLFFAQPVLLEAGRTIEMGVPPVRARDIGSCNLRVSLEDLEGNLIEGASSPAFSVVSELSLTLSLSKSEAKPGETISVTGTAKKLHSTMEKSFVTITYQDIIYQSVLEQDGFSYDLVLGSKPKSGSHQLRVIINDSFGNKGESETGITIASVPTTLKFDMLQKNYAPLEKLRFVVDFFDQAGDRISAVLNTSLIQAKLFSDDVVIFQLPLSSNSYFEHIFSSNTLPGDYALKSRFEALEAEETITILPVAKIVSTISGEMVIIKNDGNVEYNNKTVIYLEKENETIYLEKTISLAVGEEMQVNLSKEVPPGNYEVSVSEKAEPVIPSPETAQQDGQPVLGTGMVVAGEQQQEIFNKEKVLAKSAVGITSDQRSLPKKIAQGVSRITGKVVATTGRLVTSYKFAIVWLLLMAIGGLTFYWRDDISQGWNDVKWNWKRKSNSKQGGNTINPWKPQEKKGAGKQSWETETSETVRVGGEKFGVDEPKEQQWMRRYH
ncbi:hypothetical protein HYV84_02195 [Candidatus Woesearchaeota archaeon]|nr:hypothetical protein [Candidatus Woesearchaeota archaeon]